MENMDAVINDLVQRMSLRPPQKESLVRFAKAMECATPKKDADAAELDRELAAVRAAFPAAEYPDINFPETEHFDWSFLSFCFALATGVGKTRLMGAIIAYLYRVKGMRNFVVIAPGKTVYEKLIADFSEGTPKYVFKGLSCFASAKPIVVTGDTYQNGAGLLDGRDMLGHSVVINVFNIQKLNERGESHDDTQKDVARIRRVNETLGQSYFDYLKTREDLVVLMDEAHHYRATEAASTVNELKPVVGIEMTATPQVGNTRFKNILCDYGLAKAMKDGFVKEPAVVRRQNFRAGDYENRQEELDHLKLQDAMIVHEATKSALAEYATRKSEVPRIKPFVLVVAPTQDYAGEIENYIRSQQFCGGAYADKVIKVICNNRRGSNNDEAIAQLLDIERPGNKIEIVIHVNMLSEGWDVSNLYTIVPLRAANSANLVEQTIGRGLRLPFGRRTGVQELDTLSIISHDKFDEIISAARNMQITMRQQNVPERKVRMILAAPTALSGETVVTGGESGETQVQGAALNVIRGMVENDVTSTGIDLASVEMRTQIENATAASLAGVTAAMPPLERISAAVEQVMRQVMASMIDIPIVDIRPGDTEMRIVDFELDPEKLRYALRDEKLVYEFVSDRRVEKVKGQDRNEELSEDRLRQFAGDIVRAVAAFDDVDYDSNQRLVGRLAVEAVGYFNGKLGPRAMVNCMRNNLKTIAEGLRTQLMEHAVYDSGEDQVTVKEGIWKLKANALSIDENEEPRQFDIDLHPGEKSQIQRMVFRGFSKCLFSLQKFQSDPERKFAAMLERESSVLKWFKPSLSNLRLFYGPHEYTPDFVFETEDCKYLCEVKAENEMDDAVVQAKMRSAVKWCHYASEGLKEDDKPWRYMLVPDTSINGSMTLAQAVTDYGKDELALWR